MGQRAALWVDPRGAASYLNLTKPHRGSIHGAVFNSPGGSLLWLAITKRTTWYRSVDGKCDEKARPIRKQIRTNGGRQNRSVFLARHWHAISEAGPKESAVGLEMSRSGPRMNSHVYFARKPNVRLFVRHWHGC